MTTRTVTRAGRVGSPSDRNSRVAPLWRQYGHAISSAGDSDAPGTATGASHSGHASVPLATRDERARRSSYAPGALLAGSGSSTLRWKATPSSL